MIADCTLEWDNHRIPRFEYDVWITQQNGDQLPFDERGMFSLHLLAMILSLAFAASAAAIFDWRRLMLHLQQQYHRSGGMGLGNGTGDAHGGGGGGGGGGVIGALKLLVGKVHTFHLVLILTMMLSLTGSLMEVIHLGFRSR